MNRPLRVAHVTQSISSLGGGVSIAVAELAIAQQKLKTITELHSIADGAPSVDEARELRTATHVISTRFPWMKSCSLRAALRDLNADIIHSHGLWTDCSVAVVNAAQRAKIPYVVSPHGMLDAWALAHSRGKKKVAAVLFENRHLNRASVLHALCDSERNSIRNFGLRGPLATIPNGVRLPTVGRLEAVRQTSLQLKSKCLLYLGRVHPKKGLMELTSSWADLFSRKISAHLGWHLVIAGWEQGGYLRQIRGKASSANIPFVECSPEAYFEQTMNNGGVNVDAGIIYIGAVFGDLKHRMLKHADAFVLPSFSEGLPMSILEAWAYELPVAMTAACNLPDGFERAAAYPLEVTRGISTLSRGLQDFLAATDDKLLEMGQQGRRLVEEKYTWDCVAQEMLHVYRWMLGEADQPACISCD